MAEKIGGAVEPAVPGWAMEADEAALVGRLLDGKAVTQVEVERVREVVQKRLYLLQRVLFLGNSDAYRLAIRTAQAETSRVVRELERRHFAAV